MQEKGDKKKKAGWGGARPGAGRKPICGERGIYVTMSAPKQTISELRIFLELNNMPYSVFLIEALQLMKERYGDIDTPPGVFREE